MNPSHIYIHIIFGERKISKGSDIRNSLSCRNEIVQCLMRRRDYRKLDTLIPKREGLEEGWLEKKRNLGRMNEHKTIVVDSIKGREKLIAYSDGSGRKLCQCLNLGNTIGQGFW